MPIRTTIGNGSKCNRCHQSVRRAEAPARKQENPRAKTPTPLGKPVALRAVVVRRVVPGQLYSLGDGLGIRKTESEGRTHREILDLAPALAADPVVEQAIRGRASRYADLDIRAFAPVRRIERSGASLHVVSEMPSSVRLSHLLSHLESTAEVVPESAMLELASLLINAMASLHAWPGAVCHGAINPAHVLITNDGRV